MALFITRSNVVSRAPATIAYKTSAQRAQRVNTMMTPSLRQHALTVSLAGIQMEPLQHLRVNGVVTARLLTAPALQLGMRSTAKLKM